MFRLILTDREKEFLYQKMVELDLMPKAGPSSQKVLNDTMIIYGKLADKYGIGQRIPI